MVTANRLIYQAAAIPMRSGKICVVTSTSGKRWIIPKGCLEPGKTASEIALQEAWEEAGLCGLLDLQPAGTYLYPKWGTTCHVTVFRMQVEAIHERWPERSFRKRSWVTPAVALTRIGDAALRELLVRTFARSAAPIQERVDSTQEVLTP